MVLDKTLALTLTQTCALMLGAHNIAFLRISMGHFFLYNSLKGLNLKSESDDFLAPKHWASLSISQGPNYPTYR